MNKKKTIKITVLIAAAIAMIAYIFYSSFYEIGGLGKSVPFIIGTLLAIVFWSQSGDGSLIDKD